MRCKLFIFFLFFFYFLINATTQIIYTNYKKTFPLQVITLCTLTTTYIYITKQNYTYFLEKKRKTRYNYNTIA